MLRYSCICNILYSIVLIIFIGHQCESSTKWSNVFDRYNPEKAAEIIRSMEYVNKWCVEKPSPSENSLSWAFDVDECCRQLEEECEDYIPANSWQYGLFNNREFNTFLCECEDRFFQCLKQVSGSSFIAGQVVAGMHFQLMKGGCFIKDNSSYCEPRLYYNDEGYGFDDNPNQEYFCPMFHRLKPIIF